MKESLKENASDPNIYNLFILSKALQNKLVYPCVATSCVLAHLSVSCHAFRSLQGWTAAWEKVWLGHLKNGAQHHFRAATKVQVVKSQVAKLNLNDNFCQVISAVE